MRVTHLLLKTFNIHNDIYNICIIGSRVRSHDFIRKSISVEKPITMAVSHYGDQI